MQSMIICDVGGTNGRFAIADFSKANSSPDINNIRVYSCKDYVTFSQMLEAYIKSLECDIPKFASFAIAGEIRPRHGNLWHYNWEISASEIEQQFDFDHVTLLNDYEALAFGVPYFSEQDLLNITEGRSPTQNAPISVFGIGTGLGGAIAIPIEGGVKSLSAEPGHISFAPKTKLERQLSIYLYQSIHHVSNEVILSGGGIKRIYEFLGGNDLSPAEITDAARIGDDETAVKTISMFFAILASVAGDMALAIGAKGGVYIGGGVIAKIADLVNMQDFIDRFDDKGPMRSYVETIPIKFITTQNPALVGAAMGFKR